MIIKVPDDYKCKTDAYSSLGVGRNNTVLTQNNWLCQRTFLETHFNSKTHWHWDLITSSTQDCTREGWKQAVMKRDELIGLCKLQAMEIVLESVIMTWRVQSQSNWGWGIFAKLLLQTTGLDKKKMCIFILGYNNSSSDVLDKECLRNGHTLQIWWWCLYNKYCG